MAGCLSTQRLVSCQSCGGEWVTNLRESYLNCFCLMKYVCRTCCSIPSSLKSNSWHSLIHTLVTWLFYLSDLCLPVCLPLCESCSPSPDLALKWWHHTEGSPHSLSTCLWANASAFVIFISEGPCVFVNFSVFRSLRSSFEWTTGGHGSFMEESVFGSLVKVKPCLKICFKGVLLKSFYIFLKKN